MLERNDPLWLLHDLVEELGTEHFVSGSGRRVTELAAFQAALDKLRQSGLDPLIREAPPLRERGPRAPYLVSAPRRKLTLR